MFHAYIVELERIHHYRKLTERANSVNGGGHCNRLRRKVSINADIQRRVFFFFGNRPTEAVVMPVSVDILTEAGP
jgi:hypothetical protein